VEAFRKIREALPSARLWIAGRGPMEPQLRANLPDGAEILGYVSRDELAERMARAHCLLVPSVREGWGLVVIEANSVGTPAVAYNVHGVRDSVLDGVTGALVPAGDPAELASAAIGLIADKERYDAYVAAALKWAQRFSWDVTAAEFAAALAADESPAPADALAPALAL
jgi:glycosyltransferase involved in cell wall biosynthesis